jgi:epoxyqueuosine reductase
VEKQLGVTETDIGELLYSQGVEDFALLDLTSLDRGELEFHTSLYRRWTGEGRHGGMLYLEDHSPLKYHPEIVLPGARGLLLAVFPYHRGETCTDSEAGASVESPSPPTQGPRGRIARYARGRDYHKLIGKKLKMLVTVLSELFPGEKFRAFVDAGPLDERYFAWKAGLGSPGKNGLLITPRWGTWVFIAEIITTTEFFSQQNAAFFEEKGGDSLSLPACPPACTLCRNACPTGAIGKSGDFDARRCISYLTIEHRGPVPEELRPLIGDRIFGCDECQEVCPFNRNPVPTKEADFHRDIAGDSVDIGEILKIRSHSEMVKHFAGSPLMRLGPERLLRNALTVAGNSGDRSLLSAVESLTKHFDPAVREHARWALQQLS